VQWHFASVQSRWTRRALAAAGFGYPTAVNAGKGWTSIVANIEIEDLNQTESKVKLDVESSPSAGHGIATDDKDVMSSDVKTAGGLATAAPLYGVNRPFFHVDILSAVESATAILAQSGVISNRG
jgi:sodium-independent sulfate anion transporter 11